MAAKGSNKRFLNTSKQTSGPRYLCLGYLAEVVGHVGTQDRGHHQLATRLRLGPREVGQDVRALIVKQLSFNDQENK